MKKSAAVNKKKDLYILFFYLKKNIGSSKKLLPANFEFKLDRKKFLLFNA